LPVHFFDKTNFICISLNIGALLENLSEFCKKKNDSLLVAFIKTYGSLDFIFHELKQAYLWVNQKTKRWHHLTHKNIVRTISWSQSVGENISICGCPRAS